MVSGLFLFLLLLLPSPVPASCRPATPEECKENQKFIPGYQLAGEGVDVTTLQRTGFFSVDLTKYLQKNGTCMLCHNDHQGGERQRLPLAITDWHAETAKCHRAVVKTMSHSTIDVANSVAKSIRNDWKAGLDVAPKPGVNFQVSIAGSHSQAADFASGKLQEDEYIFTSDEVECRYYRFHLVRKPPLKTHFSQAIQALPLKFNSSTQSNYFRLVSEYGTHFITSLNLGGRATDITALRTCKLALDRITADEVAKCLEVEANVNVLSHGPTTANKKCEEQRKEHGIQGSFHDTYNERHVEVVGGQHENTADLIFGVPQGPEQFTAWMATLPASPGLVSYSLSPLHLLLKPQNPRREELRQAVSEYINKRARWQNCTEPCPPGKVKSSRDPCRCVCLKIGGMDENCCPQERGLARMEVTIHRAKNLWGDKTTATDAYVKVYLGGQEWKTTTVWNNNNPVWGQWIDFGMVELSRAGPLRVQVWDEDEGWNDDLLGSCDQQPVAGNSQKISCLCKHGSVEFSYKATCAAHLKGRKCLEYAPQWDQAAKDHLGLPSQVAH
ncbi:perforin-1-like [Tachyglossus aculeatus]|uniref:perforin-1-like n=1 Tax=Tachyglossus aculeatus TaxID=9261 RepID=UPI0018F56F8A|nr:perforin-1-like [Tachyglossus aculeatus]